LRNALSDEISGADSDKEVVLITLTRPLIYVQPVAVDKAILVWLNYKNAYEYWNEQRSSLNTEVLAAMPSQWVTKQQHFITIYNSYKNRNYEKLILHSVDSNTLTDLTFQVCKTNSPVHCSFS
jgi:hypothetical protein